MANNPVGTMYVELSLDATKYTAAQKAILSGAQQNSADINKVFKTVGTQSDEMYNAMRKNIENALGAIKQSHLSSTNEIRRAQESAAQKINQINEQQFGAQKSGLDILKGHYLAVTAAVAIAIGTISKAWDLARIGAEYEEQKGILDNLSRKYDTSADVIVAAMEKASDNLVAKSDLMQVALGGIARGLKPEQLINLADAAKILGDAAGVSATEALKDLASAMETGKTRALLPYLGTTLDLKASFGELESKMTAAEKAQAMYAMTMITTSQLQAQQTKDVDDASDKMERLDAKYKNIKLSVGTWMKELVVGAIDSFPKWNRQIIESDDATEALTDTVKKEAGATKALIAPYQTQIDLLKKQIQTRQNANEAAKKSVQVQEQAEKSITEAVRKAQIEINSVGQSQYEKDMNRIESEVAKYRDAKADEVLITEFAEKEKEMVKSKAFAVTAVANEKSYELYLEILGKEGDAFFEAANERQLEENKKSDEKQKRDEKDFEERLILWGKEGDAFLESLGEKELAEGKNFDKRWEMWSKFSTDIGALTKNDYEIKLAILDKERAAYEKFIDQEYTGYDEHIKAKALLDEWYSLKKQEYDEDQILRSNDFWAGMKVQYDRDVRNQKTWGEQAAAIWRDFTNRRNAFTNEMVDAFIRGEDTKIALQKAAGDMMTGLAGDISKKMWSAAIEKIISLIGAYIGQGAAASGGAGAMKGGATGALVEIGIYLGTAVAAMLAGRGIAQQFKAEGGWVAAHPGGGWVREGSGNQDDVFLGYTPGIRHWGMGGEYVVNKYAAERNAPLLEAINHDRGWDEGGPVGEDAWKPLSQTLAIGCGASFLHGLYKGGPWGGIAEAIMFNATAIPSMFIGKLLSNQFKAEGGWIDVGHGWGSWWRRIFDPFGWLGPLSNMFDSIKKMFPGFISQYIPNPFRLGQLISDPKEMERVLREIIQKPYEQVAKDVMTPNKYYTDPLDTITSNIKNLGNVWNMLTDSKLPFFYSGGLTPQAIIAGEKGPEWVVPTYEPQRSSFLRDVGADPEAIGRAVAKHIGLAGPSGGNGNGKDIHVHLHIDGKEITQTVVRGIRGGDDDLLKYIRKAARA